MGLDPQLCFDLLMEQKPLVMIKGNTDSYLENIKAFPVKSEHDAQILKLLKYTSIRMHQKAKEKLPASLRWSDWKLRESPLFVVMGLPMMSLKA